VKSNPRLSLALHDLPSLVSRYRIFFYLHLRLLLFSKGGISALVRMADVEDTSSKTIAAGALQNLAKGNDENKVHANFSNRRRCQFERLSDIFHPL
jgi:hypothetical protein